MFTGSETLPRPLHRGLTTKRSATTREGFVFFKTNFIDFSIKGSFSSIFNLSPMSMRSERMVGGIFSNFFDKGFVVCSIKQKKQFFFPGSIPKIVSFFFFPMIFFLSNFRVKDGCGQERKNNPQPLTGKKENKTVSTIQPTVTLVREYKKYKQIHPSKLAKYLVEGWELVASLNWEETQIMESTPSLTEEQPKKKGRGKKKEEAAAAAPLQEISFVLQTQNFKVCQFLIGKKPIAPHKSKWNEMPSIFIPDDCKGCCDQENQEQPKGCDCGCGEHSVQKEQLEPTPLVENEE